eukprot:188839-Rhodomonas_salina.1
MFPLNAALSAAFASGTYSCVLFPASFRTGRFPVCKFLRLLEYGPQNVSHPTHSPACAWRTSAMHCH